MANSIIDTYGGQQQIYDRLESIFGFKFHVALPCIVQSYNREQRTVDVQPAIREKITQPNLQYKYEQYPLLINVPVVFPCSGDYELSMPVGIGDECLVVFSDLAIDNWFVKGNVQNPVEQRRHDLSDGIAIFGLRSKSTLSKIAYKADPNALELVNNKTGARVGITATGGYIKGSGEAKIEIDKDGGTITAMVPGEYGPYVDSASFASIIRNPYNG